MPRTALITGASSGLGREFARIHAETGGDVILTARREDRLRPLAEELQARHGIAAHLFALDLAKADGPERLHRAVRGAGLVVDILINNAGFGGHGIHTERDLADEMRMIDLNVKALVALTHRFGRDMAGRGHGRILNVGSTAGFMPGPNQAVYFATKALVQSFSQAVDHELRGRGVTCTVLAPGYVETEFADIAKLRGTAMVRAGGAAPEEVARKGYAAMMAGDLVRIDRPVMAAAIGWLIPLLPRRLVLRLIERTQT